MKKIYFVEFSSPLIKEEKKLIRCLIEKELRLSPLKFLLDDLEVPELKSSKINFIDRFSRKGVYIHFSDEVLYIPIFEYYQFKDNVVEFSFNQLFVKYLKDEEKIFQYNLPQVLFFKCDFSKDFFYEIVKPNFLNSKIELTLDELKAVINKDKYKRLYDVKRFLIAPLVEDINLSTDFKLSYKIEKIDKNYTIIFYIKNNRIDKEKNYVENFLRLYKYYILEPEKIGKIIFEAIQTYGYDYAKDKLLLAIKNKKKYDLKFDDIFEKFLSNELGDFYINLKTVECQPKDLEQLRKIVFKELSFLDIPEVAKFEYNTKVTQKIFAMKEKEKIEIISENLKLEILYNTEKKSRIIIYLRYNK